MPRGPYVFTRLRSSHSADRTSWRVAPPSRRARESSAADRTCACTASSVDATAATEVPDRAGRCSS
ncbi:hypothetical protein OG288_16625 [Streptomyces tauricus]|uniref:Uncharacterized protein n=1 Tax=Streptomyces tauricus TaxID=68274 RepID=A0ABZ1JUF7_9ACTN